MPDRINMARKAEILKEVEARYGQVTPDTLIEEARSGRIHDLHEYFDWDANSALERSLKVQARTFITSVTTWYTHRNHSYEAVSYVRDPSKPAKEQGYRSVTYLRSNPDEALQSVLLECKNAEAALVRARTHGLILGHFELIDDLITRVQAAMNEMRPARGARGAARHGTHQERMPA